MLSPLPRFNPTKTQSVMFQKKQGLPALGSLPSPPPSNVFARISPPTKVVQRGRTRATKWRQGQINLGCTKYTGGCTEHACDGFPPKRNPKPRSAPRVRGFSCESAHVELLQTMQSAVGRNRPLGERLTGCPSCNRWQAA
jgi:hypothetical protein